jgi:hypothetical protein
MDETQRLRLSITRELVVWGMAIPKLLARIAAALKMPASSGRQKLDFEVMARRITTAFNAIGETPDGEADEVMLYN